ncbi:hypothetical protein HJG54_27370 [Leptolyngbya sp. NK1-12]|uniref:C-type lysozyme inhibitor domain-containing protein n=1 Tax=Leptolyngbya sp. NK1-12 TaxID=2547451 RepID=A0AA97AI31_9CYAN|nr:hypothetical protein HJG54_27370 [Leptolyngbya sp. NK1-12]
MKWVQYGAVALPLLMAMPLSAQAQVRLVEYQCEAGRSFRVEYAGDAAQVMRGADSVTLPSVVSASGARYSNGQITLFTKGNQAFIEENGEQTYRNCVGQAVSSSQSTSQRVTYQCRDGRSFSAHYLDDSVELVLDGRTLTLPQVVSGSGIRYSDGITTLASKGNEAFVEVNGTMVYRDCLAEAASTQPPARPIPGLW